mmetsp:Transcript_18004/g.25227  ORF Transcript_18004/g.25227 Transcript_18004/m.25227 type:complete len:116 (-) Transcript_18004:12-359(-)
MFDFARIAHMDHFARVRFIRNYIIGAAERAPSLSSQQERVQALERCILESIEEQSIVSARGKLRFHVFEACCLAEIFYGATSFLTADFQLHVLSNALRKAFDDYKMSIVSNDKNR